MRVEETCTCGSQFSAQDSVISSSVLTAVDAWRRDHRHPGRTVGICGSFAPKITEAPGETCSLPAGHAGWHWDNGCSWTDLSPSPSLSLIRSEPEVPK
jgi:hypothetical protein